mgnify:CR=1 FL=1
MTKYDYQTVGPNNDPCDGWCVVKYADNCHPQKIAEGLTRSEAAMMAAAPELLATLRGLLARAESRISEDTNRYPEFAAARAAIAKAAA